MFLLKVLVNTHSCRIKKKFTFKSRFIDFLKFKRFKKREWICSHLQQKVEEFKLWAPIFIQKTLKKTKIAYYNTLFIFQSKGESHFCALDLNLSTFLGDVSKSTMAFIIFWTLLHRYCIMKSNIFVFDFDKNYV